MSERPLPADNVAAIDGSSSAGRTLAEFVAFLRSRPRMLSGYVVIVLVAVLGLAAPLLPLRSPVDADAAAFLLPPSLQHPMGTDSAGLDIFSRVIHAPRVDLFIALLSTAFSASIGSMIGAFVGLWEGRGGPKGAIAILALRAADVLQAFPAFALALVLVAVLGQGVTSIVLALGFVSIPIYLRLMRGEALVLRGQAFVEAAQLAGAGDVYVVTRHIAPNAAAPIFAQVTVNTGVAVLLTAGLSFLGAGVRAPTPEWGGMIASGFQNIVTGQWWPSIFPGLALAATVFGFGQIGASIRAWSSPRERARPSPRAWRAFVASFKASG